MQCVSFFSLNASNHKLFKKLEDFLDLKSVCWNRGEKVKISPMRISEFHHDDWVKLNIEFEGFRELIEEIDPSV